jgi:hypothetical protein
MSLGDEKKNFMNGKGNRTICPVFKPAQCRAAGKVIFLYKELFETAYHDEAYDDH